MSQKYETFPAIVCQRLRNLVDVRTKAENHRKKLFDKRDQLEEEIAGLSKAGKKAEVQELKAQCFDVIKEIDKDRKTINWCNGEISEAVEKADEPKLWNTADVEVPTFEETGEEDAEDPDQQTIGKPGTPKPSRGRTKPAPEAEPPEGWNQHLTASVNELDINDAAKQKLVDAGFVTIGALHQFITSGKDLRAKLNVSENFFSPIMRSYKRFLKDHTKADMEATKDGRGGVA